MNFSDKKILLTAYSLNKESESQALVEYLIQRGAKDITTLFWGGEAVAKQIPVNVKKIEITSVNDFDESIVKDFDLVFRHTMTRPNQVSLAKNISSATIEFFKNCPAPIIGVTGTKGKGTTSTLIHKMLVESGKTSHLVGNIGEPAIRQLPNINADDLVVFEISSFQLWDLKQSPHVAVVLMIEPDHLDVHKNMQEYVEAKANIAKFQSIEDYIYYHPTNQHSSEIAKLSLGTKQKFIDNNLAYYDENHIYLRGQALCNVGDVGLIGRHNLENICAALSAVSNYVDDIGALKSVIKEFKGLEHRIEFVRQVSGVRYFNDSYSSAQLATVAAINSFSDPIILIVGGYDKQVELGTIADAIVEGNVKKVILIGQTALTLARLLDNRGYKNYVLTEKLMNDVVNIAKESADSGDIVLLSPGSASFDQYKNFKQRGELFREAVNSL